MNTKIIAEHKLHLILTERQRAILVGLLLGDGHLETQNNGRTYRLKVEHSIGQKDYVEWLYNAFAEWVNTTPYTKEKNGRLYTGFTTYSHGAFRFYAQQFYVGKKKHMPKLIKKLLSEIALAVWFMDDGSLKSERHRTYIIHTLGFQKSELEVVQVALQSLFGLETRLHRQKEKYWRLYIVAQSAKRFEELVLPIAKDFPSMQNKLSNRVPKK
jgi:recombination protein RecA